MAVEGRSQGGYNGHFTCLKMFHSFFAWYKSKQYPYFNSVTSARARVYLPYRFPILRRTNIATFEGCVAVTWRPMQKTEK